MSSSEKSGTIFQSFNFKTEICGCQNNGIRILNELARILKIEGTFSSLGGICAISAILTSN